VYEGHMTINNTTLKTTGATVLQALGLHHILRFVNRHKAAVLLYHSVMRDDETGVIPPWAIQESQFRWQMEYIARHYQVLSLPDYIERLMAGRPVPPHSLILTFDDGFRDNYTVAYPILKELGLPATIFVVTGYLDSDQALWPDVLFYAIYRTPVQFLDLRDLGDGAHYLRSLTERNAAFRRLIGYLKELTVEEKNHWLDEIARRLQLDLNWEADGEAPFALLRRQDIQHMAQEGLVTFGVHTETHEILTRFPFEQAQQEIRISKQKLEALLGTPARFFAYPNGTEQDFNDALKGELRQQGFTCAFASRGGLVNAHFDPFALARLGIGPEESRAYFKLKLSGAVHAVEQVKNWMVGS
jgi:peptidoglycan/xylan/chitin deacetylase (PgdA/CDA1 family)